jgi:hypothetical protein
LLIIRTGSLFKSALEILFILNKALTSALTLILARLFRLLAITIQPLTIKEILRTE